MFLVFQVLVRGVVVYLGGVVLLRFGHVWKKQFSGTRKIMVRKGMGPGFMSYVQLAWTTPMVILRADDITAWIAVLANR